MGFKILRKLSKIWLITRLYSTAKIKVGYGLRVTGDIDIPENFLTDKGKTLLTEWIALANKISTESPILYVTISEPTVFAELTSFIKDMDKNIIIGTHGWKHFHFSRLRTATALINIQKCSQLSKWFRFPYLDTNLKLLRIAANYFHYDSSITSKKLHPFKIGSMWEYPVTPPSDTVFRDKGFSNHILRKYLSIIPHHKKQNKFVTFLFHPNDFSIKLMKNMKVKL